MAINEDKNMKNMRRVAFTALGCIFFALALSGLTARADDHGFTVFMEDGGWCWYQDPRAIIHDGKLFMGAVKGGGDGEALIGVYDLEARQSLGTVTAQAAFDHDDHNAPVFHVRPDGGVLATYAKHNRDPFHYSRISDPSNPNTSACPRIPRTR